MNAIPSPEGVPSEVENASLPYSLPHESKSNQIRIQPTNLSTIVSNTYTLNSSAFNEIPFPVQNIYFDLPCSGSPSTFIDTRQTLVNFKVTYEIVSAGSSAVVGANAGYLRSSGNSFINRMSVIGQSGNYLEDINEYDLTADTLIQLQMSNSVRDGVALSYGFGSNASYSSQGHGIPFLTAGATLAVSSTTHSYSLPLMSSILGVTSDKWFNIGRTTKIQCVLQSPSIAPLTIQMATQTTAATMRVTISDITLQCEYIDIGGRALAMLDQSLIDGKQYLHGVTYKTSANTLPATSGSISVLAGLRASSVKSLFARFYDNAVTINGSCNGKFDSKNFSSQLNFNIGGVRYPPLPTPVFLQPALAFNTLQQAIGSFNSTEFQSAIPTAQYCKLSQGLTAQALTNTNQAYEWNLGSQPDSQCSFFYGVNTEIVAKRGTLSGLNCNSSAIFLEMNIPAVPTNSHNIYVTAALDVIYVHDVRTGEVLVRM